MNRLPKETKKDQVLIQSQRGAVLILTACLAAAILGVAILAGDLGRLYTLMTRLQNTANLAALAGARTLADDPAPPEAYQVTAPSIKESSFLVVVSNKFDPPAKLHDDNIILGFYNGLGKFSEDPLIVGDRPVRNQNLSINAVKVILDYDLSNSIFFNIFNLGSQNTTMSREAIAHVCEPGHYVMLGGLCPCGNPGPPFKVQRDLQELCDDGSPDRAGQDEKAKVNGKPCTDYNCEDHKKPACTYCDLVCQTAPGPFCGDQIKNGKEECDNPDIALCTTDCCQPGNIWNPKPGHCRCELPPKCQLFCSNPPDTPKGNPVKWDHTEENCPGLNNVIWKHGTPAPSNDHPDSAGDSLTSNPFTYNKDGTYNAYATTTYNGSPIQSLECSVNITKEEDPCIGDCLTCSGDPNPASFNETVTWTPHWTGSSKISNVVWKFEDQDAQQVTTPLNNQSKYSVAGKKTATVTVQTESGSKSATCSIEVNDLTCTGEPLEAALNTGLVTWKTSGEKAVGNGPYTYEWTGTDDLKGSMATTSRTYAKEGIKIATIKVTDELTKKSKTSKECKVEIIPPEIPPISCVAVLNKTEINEPMTWKTILPAGTDVDLYNFAWMITDTENVSSEVSNKINFSVPSGYPTAGTYTGNVTLQLKTDPKILVTSEACTLLVKRPLEVCTGDNCITCEASPKSAELSLNDGKVDVTWTAKFKNAADAEKYNLSWGLDASGASAASKMTYRDAGGKNATITATPKSGGESISGACPMVVNLPQLECSCAPNATEVFLFSPVTWTPTLKDMATGELINLDNFSSAWTFITGTVRSKVSLGSNKYESTYSDLAPDAVKLAKVTLTHKTIPGLSVTSPDCPVTIKLGSGQCDDKTPCSPDANKCITKTCVNNQCIPSTKTCSAESACKTSKCDPSSGECVDTNKNEDKSCSHEIPCSDAICQNGTCTAKSTQCDDGKPCTKDTCPGLIDCVHEAPGENGSLTWDCDGNLCTAPDRCDNGANGACTPGLRLTTPACSITPPPPHCDDPDKPIAVHRNKNGTFVCCKKPYWWSTAGRVCDECAGTTEATVDGETVEIPNHTNSIDTDWLLKTPVYDPDSNDCVEETFSCKHEKCNPTQRDCTVPSQQPDPCEGFIPSARNCGQVLPEGMDPGLARLCCDAEFWEN